GLVDRERSKTLVGRAGQGLTGLRRDVVAEEGRRGRDDRTLQSLALQLSQLRRRVDKGGGDIEIDVGTTPPARSLDLDAVDVVPLQQVEGRLRNRVIMNVDSHARPPSIMRAIRRWCESWAPSEWRKGR